MKEIKEHLIDAGNIINSFKTILENYNNSGVKPNDLIRLELAIDSIIEYRSFILDLKEENLNLREKLQQRAIPRQGHS